jgi:hypothetical protein
MDLLVAEIQKFKRDIISKEPKAKVEIPKKVLHRRMKRNNEVHRQATSERMKKHWAEKRQRERKVSPPSVLALFKPGSDENLQKNA